MALEAEILNPGMGSTEKPKKDKHKRDKRKKDKLKLEDAQNSEGEIVEDVFENGASKDKDKKKKKMGEANDQHESENGEVKTNGHVNGQGTDQKKKKKKKFKDENDGSQGGDNDKKRKNLDYNKVVSQNPKKIKGENQADREDSESMKSDEQVMVSGMGAQDPKFKALQSFSEVQVSANVLECCNKFKKPSPIQAHAWPFLLEGRNLIGIAKTGSGKTLAFGLPALVYVMKNIKQLQKQRNPLVMVLSPTRELAQQISDVLEEAGRPCGVRTVCLYGGTSKKPQITALRSGVEIVVATPGRLQDLVDDGHCSLKEVSYVVLDEADRMLDLGFEHVVRALIGQTLRSRQMIMFSATWPVAVDQLSKEFMGGNPIKVVVGSQDLAANHAVTQIVEVIDAKLRDSRLQELLKDYHKSEKNRILVFVLYKKEAARVESMLERRGWKVSAVHGDKGQFDRNKAVTSFKDGTCPLLIATDVAARGLDIPDVEYVINYSFPLTTEDYVHRIGRTGRAGKSGIAHTFFTQADKARAGELVNVLNEAGQTVPSELLKFGCSVKKKESKLYGAHFKEVTADAPKATKITFDSDEE